jgi:hypothetical protein
MQNMDPEIGRETTMRIPIDPQSIGGLPFGDPDLKWNYVAALTHDLSELLRTVKLPSRECDPDVLNKFQAHNLVYMDVFSGLFPLTRVQLQRIKTSINILIVDDVMEALDKDIESFKEPMPAHFEDVGEWRKHVSGLMSAEMNVQKPLQFKQVYDLYQVFKRDGDQAMRDHYKFIDLMCTEDM